MDILARYGTIRNFVGRFAGRGADVYQRWALICVLAESIPSVNVTLACDFLKEIGYLNFAKPDKHVKTILGRVGLLTEFREHVSHKTQEFLCFYVLDSLAQVAQRSMFEVDKAVWLLGTGFNRRTGRSIGAICGDNPQCARCSVGNRGLCDYSGRA
jgi:hypothetical protein